MNQLITINQNNEGNSTVNAKELYLNLGYNKTHWSKWHKKNITDNDFAVEGLDYEGFALSASGNTTKDFAITLDFAKKLCMLARTKKGEEIRNYFIACEQKLLAQQPKALTLEEMTIQVISGQKQRIQQLEATNQKQEQVIQIAAPKVEYYNDTLNSKDAMPVTLVAKSLSMSAVKINRELNKIGVIHKVGGSWVLYQQYENFNLTKPHVHTYTKGTGEKGTSESLHWTQKGRRFIHILFKQNIKEARKFMRTQTDITA